MRITVYALFFFFFSSRRRHTRFLPVSWARGRSALLTAEHADETLRVAPRILSDVVEDRPEIRRQLIQPVVEGWIAHEARQRSLAVRQHLHERIARLSHPHEMDC